MIISILFFVPVLTSFLYSYRAINFFITFLLIFFSIFLCIRFTQGIPDYVQYKFLYEKLDLSKFSYPFFSIGGTSGRETLFATLMSIASLIISFEIFYGLLCAILFSSTFAVSRMLVERQNVFCFYGTLITFFSINFFVISVRNGIVVVLFYYSVAILKNRKHVQSTLALLVSHMFHFMGILSPIIFLLLHMLKVKFLRVILSFGLVLLIFGYGYFFQLFSSLFGYSGYLYVAKPINLLTPLLFVFIAILAFWLMPQEQRYKVYSPIILLVYNLLFIFILRENGSLYSRFLPVIAGLSLGVSLVIVLNKFIRSPVRDLGFMFLLFIAYMQINRDRGFVFVA